ncbi:MAG TPA: amino acid adenylation domain-containing protein [Kofleriaceae bacterium]|nr:amino acid adenylation domain-containing protein [Kofleriaceae bacterium]
MVPSAYVALAALPVTANGKLDRAALPAPDAAAYPHRAYEPPRDDRERRLAEIWAELLHVERVGRHDSFFELGGHSLLAIQLVSRLRKAFGVELALGELFAHARLAELAARLEGAARSQLSPIPIVDRSRPLALSPAQQRLWFLTQLDGASLAYHITGGARLAGALDPGALHRALVRIVERHEALRTRFPVVDGQPVPQVLPAPAAHEALVFDELDLRGTPDPESGAQALVDAHCRAAFDLTRELPIRVRLIRVADDVHLLHVALHHLAADGGSVAILLDELCQLYRALRAGAPDPLPPLGVQYADHAAWQRDFLAGGALAVQQAFWQHNLAGAPRVLELPGDRPRPALPDHAGASIELALPAALTDALRALGHRHGVTPYMTLLAGWAAVLGRLAGQDEVVIGSPVAGRNRPETEPLIGCFVNTLALRIDLRGAPTVPELLARVRDQVLAAQAHQDIAFDQVVEAVKPPRSRSHPPVFQVMLDWQAAGGALELPGLAVTGLPAEPPTAQFDLTLSLRDDGARITGAVNYATALFDRATIERHVGYLQTWLAGAVADELRPIDQLPVVPDAERTTQLVAWNAPHPCPADRCLHTWFEAQVARTPDAIAVVHGAERVRYRELNARANQLARHLRRCGVGPDRRVAVCVDRGVALVEAILAIVKAGGAYVPLDPAYPSSRLGATLDDSQPAVLVVDRTGRAALIDLAADAALWQALPADDLEGVGIEPGHLAYVIYTSGSTGRPNGVMVEHAQVVRLFLATEAWYRFTAQDVWTLFHSISFDFSVWELWGALLYGGRLVIVPLDTARSPREFYELVCDEGVTVLNQTPSAFQQLIAAQADSPRSHRLRTVVFGGEALVLHALKPWYARNGERTELVNMYGITETTVHVTHRALHAADADRPGPSPIGVRIPDLRLYVLDAHRQPVPIGATGELYVGGAGVARGYLHQPELTAERFIADPFVAGGRLYRTGDLGRWRADGTLEYLGRNDFQVKIRGFRIELGEIETRLAQVAGVRDVVVAARQDVPGDQRLVAYYVADADDDADAGGMVEALRAHAARELPSYMVPSAYVRLAALPLTTHGKLDRKALPAPEDSAYARPAYEPPADELERQLAAIWAELLQVDQVGRHDSFFELGGHSLLAVRLASRLRDRLGVELALGALFGQPVLRDLADLVRNAARAAVQPIPVIDRTGPVALSPAQQRLWFLTQLEGASTAYHIAGGVRLTGALDRPALHRALARIVERHEALRTRFELVGGRPVQIVRPSAELAIDEVCVRDAAELAAVTAAHAGRRFELSRELPVRVLVVRIPDGQGPADHVLHVTIHHIVADDWSIGVLLDELSRLYRAFVAGQPDPLPALAVQYGDYAAWQRGRLAGGELDRQTAFWRTQLAGAPTLLELPCDRARPAEQDHAGATLAVALPAALSEQIRAVSRRHGATPYMTLLASWAATLGRLSGQDEVVIGSPISGRNRPELEPLIGCFVNTLALRIDLRGEPTVAELIARTRAQVLAAQAHQDLAFDQVVEAVKPARTLAHTPLFQVLLDWQNAPEGELAMPDLALTPLPAGPAAAHFDLTLTLRDAGDAITGALNYATALFDPATVERHLGHWRSLLEAFVAGDDQRASRLPVLDPAERARLVVAWNATAGAYPDACIHQLIEAQAQRAPGDPAVVLGDQVLSYGELDARANQLARHLRQRGVGPDRLVAISAERSIELIVGMLGVLKAGGAYVPVDLELPAQRIDDMLDDAAPCVLLTRHRPERAERPERADRAVRVPEIIALADDWPEIARHDAGALDPASIGVTPRHLAYVIFTSGSTGRPKGVMIEHRSIVNYASHVARQFDVAGGDGALIFTSFQFDLTLTGVYPPLVCGRALRLCPEGNDLAAWRAGLLAASNLAPVKLTPSHLALLQQALAGDPIDGRIRTLVLGGEALKGSALTWWRDHAPGTRIFNHYGPTETTVGCVVHEVIGPPPASVPIGRPITNMRAYVLDPAMQPVPIGVAGELYIAGVGVARGYLGRPELTRERFLPDPFADGDERMYRTGDIARWRGDGTIEYLGRRDHQVKLRGFRIELGEIEAALLTHPGVEQAFAMAREDVPGDPRLVAYVTSREPGEPGAPVPGDELRRHVASCLPPYMVPAAVVALAAMPLTANGKVDRAALPVPDGEPARAAHHEPPRGEAECVLARLWQELLGVDQVGRHDNFFELGGHSLLAVSLIERMRQAGLHVDVKALFTTASLAELAAQAGGDAREVAVPPNRIPPGAGRITPDMLTLVDLDQDAIDAIVRDVPGGAANVQDIYPLAPLQDGMLFHHLWSPTGDAYVESHLLAFPSRARLDRLLGALQHVIDRHDILRTAIAWDGLPQPVQVVHRRAALPVELVEPELAGASDVAAQLAARFDPRRTRFDLARPPLLRCHIAEDAANGRWILSVLAHHLAVDHTTLELLVDEARAIEHGQLDRLAPPVPFRNYVARSRLASHRAEHEAVFSQRLGDIDEPTAPFGLLDVQGDGSGIIEARHAVPAPTAAAIRAQARRLRVSPASLFHLAWGLVLARTTGRSEVVFGTVLFGRMQGAEADRALGLFMNTLPLRVSVDARAIEHGVLDTHARLVELMQHEHAPLALAQRCSAVPPGLPLFTTLLNYRYSAPEARDAPRPGEPEIADDIEFLHAIERTSYPITLSVDDMAGEFALTAQVSAAIAPERVCALMQTALDQLACSLAETPARPACELDVLPPAERDQLLAGWNATTADTPRDACLHQLFEAQVTRTPDAIAVVHGAEQLSYRELNARANRLAHYLRAHGVGPDARVALAVDRGVDLVVGLLGILKAGGAYVPIDPSYPAERVAYMQEHARPVQVITPSWLADRRAELAGYPDDDPAPGALAPHHLAYVIYTSGSTGRPKGVMIEHASAVNFMAAMQRAPGLLASDVLLAVTSLSFDIAALELVLPVLCGARIVIASRDEAANAEQLRALIERHAVTVMQATPSTWRMLVEQPWPVLPHPLKVLCGGEALPPGLAEQLVRRAPEVWNLYGPTETTIWSTACRVSGPAPTIGRPIANTRVYVLDARLRPVPVGVAGELYIGGAGVARGYLDQPALTAERFLDDPFAGTLAPGRIYRTGDLVRWRADGTLDYLGRNDFQVKLRGFRIELGEIEARLAQLPGVRDVVVVAREDAPGDPRLVAYHTGDRDAAALRAHAAAGLPAYMVPSAYVALVALPRTPNGKIDRKALPAPGAGAYVQPGHEPPHGELEAQLARIWSALLHVEQVGRHDSFFELGGHSILAVQLVSRLRTLFGRELALAQIFEHPRLSALAEHLGGAARAAHDAIAPIERGGPLPISLAQQRLWILDRLSEGRPAHHPRGAVRLRGPLDRPALAWALGAIVGRHEALRTHFHVVDGHPRQVVQPAADELAVDERDLRGHRDPEAAARAAVRDHAAAPFDLERDPMLRAIVLQLADDEHVVQVVTHHIASDGWSMAVLLDELSRLYNARRRGEPDPLPALPIQYADYAAWQRRHLERGELDSQGEFWRQNLAGAPPLLTLPTDRPRPPHQDHAGATIDVRIDRALTARLEALGRRHAATMYMTLLAGWAATLGRLAGQDDVVIGSPVAGRNRAEVEPLIGCFVNTLAMRIDLDGDPSVAQLLARTRTQVLAATRHQDLPFDQVVELVKPPRSLSHAPIFQVMFAWQNAPAGALALDGLEPASFELPQASAQFDLRLALAESDGDAEGEIAGTLSYATAVFDRASAERIAACFERVLRAAVADGADHQPISRLPLVGDAERAQVIAAWNATRAPYPDDACFHELFERQAARTPDATAVVSDAGALSYRELDERANRLARHLRKRGVVAGSRVAICIDRSADMVVALLATLKAGGAYVPLDPGYPPDRLAYMLADSAPAVVLVDAVGRDAVGPHPALDLAAGAARWAREPADNLGRDEIAIGPRSLAYLIYTSGSTGQPKGVLNEHRGLCNLVTAQSAMFGVEPDSRVLQFASFSFDASISEVGMALVGGASLHVASRAELMPGPALTRTLAARRITHVTLPPSALALCDLAQFAATTLIVAGEAIAVRDAQRWSARVALFNAYGPTETAVCATIHRCEAVTGATVPIGRPIPNARIYVLDRHREPVPVGVIGEIYIGGDGVGRGYLNRPELTAERFLGDPFTGVAGDRMYRTGDLGRWLPDGTVEYLGRNDHQVKIRGFRIELGEIEAGLAALDGVGDVVVLAREDQPGDRRLVAYYTAAEPIPVGALRKHLADRLPEYMVPSAYVHLAALPVTGNGKLDRRALPAPEGQAYATRAYEAPQGELEHGVARLWSELLNVDRVGRHDSFFDLGGHSLLAVQMLARLRELAGAEVALRALFAAPTLMEFCAIAGRASPEHRASNVTPFRTAGDQRPVFFIHPGLGEIGYVSALLPGIDPAVPVYGLSAIGYLAGEQPLDTIEAMAAAYVSGIRQVQPHGPYRIVGWCAGGNIGYEMAHQLVAAGERLDFLAFIDAPSGGPVDPSWLASVLSRLPDDIPDELRARLTELDRLGDTRGMLVAAQAAGFLPVNLPLDIVERYLAVQHAIKLAKLRYVPPPLAITLTHYLAEHREGAWPMDGWERVASKVEYVQVAGDHMTMVAPPHARRLAELISAAMARASEVAP